MASRRSGATQPESLVDASEAQALLRAGAALINGVNFSRDDTFPSPVDVYTAFVSEDGSRVTETEVSLRLDEQVSTMIRICLDHQDVYILMQGGDEFWTLVQSAWECPHLLPSEIIQNVFFLFIYARHGYVNATGSSRGRRVVPAGLIVDLDEAIEMMQGLEASRFTRGRPGLVAPTDNATRSRLANHRGRPITWPEPSFKSLDVAVLGESRMKKILFGVSPTIKAEDQIRPRYPHDQSDPFSVRRYLSWLALTEAGPLKKVSLLLSPVGFLKHQNRQSWHRAIGPQARYYSTVDDFVDYADAQLRSDDVEIVLGLMTPWFYSVSEVEGYAESRNEDVADTWLSACYRSGMMVAIVKATEVKKRRNSDGKWIERHWKHRVFLFRPWQPSWHRTKQDKWIEDLLERIEKSKIITVRESWIDGEAKYPEVPDRKVRPDSVELSCEFITEILEDPSTLPQELEDIVERCFIPTHPGQQRQTPSTDEESEPKDQVQRRMEREVGDEVEGDGDEDDGDEDDGDEDDEDEGDEDEGDEDEGDEDSERASDSTSEYDP